MKTVRYFSTLSYYDGPQIFEARDAIGGHYVAVMTPSDAVAEGAAGRGNGASERYLVAGVAPEQLRLFRSGALDLRSLLTGSSREERYLAKTITGIDGPLELERLTTHLEGSTFLPDPGFLLHDHLENDSVLTEARERNNLVLELTAEPKESALGHRIRANTLAELLLRVQAMVKCAYRAEVKARAFPKSLPDADMMDVVVPAAAGSFRIVLEAASLPDLFGDRGLARALPRIDKLFEHTDNPQDTRSIIREHRGHLANAYLMLLRFLMKSGMGLRYSWAEPNSETPSIRSVLERELQPLVDALSSVEKLGIEQVTLEGTFDKFDRNTGSWALQTDEERVSGKIREEGPNLDGLTVGRNYRFFCDDEMEEVEITGRESSKLYLYRHEPA